MIIGPSTLRARELLLEPSIPIRIKPLIGIAEGFDAFLIKAALVSHYRIVASASDALGNNGEGHAAGDTQQAFGADDGLAGALFAGRMLSRSCFLSKVSGRSSSYWRRVMSYSRHWSRWQLALKNRRIVGLLETISNVAAWDEQLSVDKALSKREEAVLQALELMTRQQPEWIKAAELREQVQASFHWMPRPPVAA